MKYPNILFFRFDKYSNIDKFFEDNKDKHNFTLNVVNCVEELNKIFNPVYHILVTYGESVNEYLCSYEVISGRISERWLHFNEIKDIDKFNHSVNYCYINYTINEHASSRPIFSIFTTTYNSYNKIFRAYKSLKWQTMNDWEWVIVDDSPDEEHFKFLKEQFLKDNKVRLYRRSQNSGSIGDVKNEAVSLCRGKYVLELDHDDEILPNVLYDASIEFHNDPEVGFIYMDFINTYENGGNTKFGDFICKGYGGYYSQKYNGRWVYVYITPNINNITLTHLVCCPNHPRIWRRDTLYKLGNYSEYLPICDDYEILLRTGINTKITKIHKFGYIQYINNDSNFSYVRNHEINRIGPYYISQQFYEKYKVDEVMKKLNSYEDEKYKYNYSQIWKRDDEYEHKYCNNLKNPDYNKQYCIITLETLIKNMEKIKELYKDDKSDFLLLDNKGNTEHLQHKLDEFGFSRMKCYDLENNTKKELINYFLRLYKSCKDFEIICDVEHIPEESEDVLNNEPVPEESEDVLNNEPVPEESVPEEQEGVLDDSSLPSEVN
jgi:glycosyltransferase involved in cell wall biosynthesis